MKNSKNSVEYGKHIYGKFCTTGILSSMKLNHCSHLEKSKDVTSEIFLEEIHDLFEKTIVVNFCGAND